MPVAARPRRLVTYAVVSAKPSANNIKIWFSRWSVVDFPTFVPQIDTIKSREVPWWIRDTRARKAFQIFLPSATQLKQ